MTNPDNALFHALAAIEARCNRPRNPAAETRALARKYAREADRLKAGGPIGDDAGGFSEALPGVAERWAPKLRRQAKRLDAEANLLEARADEVLSGRDGPARQALEETL